VTRGFIGLAIAVALAGCGGGDGGGDAAERTVTVTETTDSGTKTGAPDPEAPADAIVTEYGARQVRRTAYYGAVIENPSRAQEAQEVRVTVRIRDRRDDVIAREVVEVAVVPPGAQFNVGGALELPGRKKVASVDVRSKAANGAEPEHPLARVTNVRVEPQEYGGLRVHAIIENTLLSNLPPRARVYAVLRDGDGQIVGGLSGTAGHVIRPRERSPLELELTEDLPDAVKAGVSVDSPVTP
jgi:hypothetical protein